MRFRNKFGMTKRLKLLFIKVINVSIKKTEKTIEQRSIVFKTLFSIYL